MMIAATHFAGLSTAVATNRAELLVLVVEDSKLVRDRLVRLLSEIPNLRIVAEAATAADAIRKIGDLEPDMVTLDLRLEKSSGLDVLRAIEGGDRRPCIAVLSNQGDPEARRECLALGADFFFDKSREMGDLKTMISGLAASIQPGDRVRRGRVTRKVLSPRGGTVLKP